MTGNAIAGWSARVKAAENRGELLIAYDLAARGLARHPDNVDLRYLATRVLARSGATDHAAAAYARFGLDRSTDPEVEALGARLAKDRALHAPRARRRRLLLAAAAAYRKIYLRTHAHYPAVNAATLYLLAGEERYAKGLAKHAIEAASAAKAATEIERYWCAATRAEAWLIRGNLDAARDALHEAARHRRKNFAASAATSRQLRLVCLATKVSTSILDVIRPPAVLYYHGPSAGIPPRRRAGQPTREEIAAYLRHYDIGFAYGSLAAGGEILCAEACLAAGVELNLILPFRKSEFVTTFVLPAGRSWVRRFEACLDRAQSLSFATADSYQGDDDLLAYGRRLSTGMAILRAQHLEAEMRHLSLDADGGRLGERGDASDARRGIPIDLPPPSASAASLPRRASRSGPIPPRFARAILFGDVKNYSDLPDRLIPTFQRRFMGAVSSTLRRFADHVLFRNSWGDAIYVVVDDPIIGAECALRIQSAIARVKLKQFGFPSEPQLRLAMHFGPLYDGHDAIRGERSFFGAHATLTARIEPVTPPGRVYVSEAMAAALAVSPGHRFRCEYVGKMPAAKDFGLLRMYSLDRALSSRHES